MMSEFVFGLVCGVAAAFGTSTIGLIVIFCLAIRKTTGGVEGNETSEKIN